MNDTIREIARLAADCRLVRLGYRRPGQHVPDEYVIEPYRLHRFASGPVVHAWQSSPVPDGASPWRDESVPLLTMPPVCPSCGGLARPAVVWFGESLPAPALDAALQACSCDVFLTVGTSALVYPAAGLVHEARRRGAFSAEINLEPTPATGEVDLALHGPADQLLPNIAARLTL